MDIRFTPRTLAIDCFLDGNWLTINDNVYTPIVLDDLKKIDRYRLEVSLACNLRCAYCVVHMNRVAQQNTIMSLETAKKIVNRFNDEVGRDGSIFLMGGEPLLNIDVVRYIIDNVLGRSIIFTNALGLTKELVSYFINREVYVLTSLDGSTLIHNEKRFQPKVRENFDIVTKNISYAIAAGCKVGVSCLLHNGNVTDAISIASYFVDSLKATAMSFAYPHLTVNPSDENEFDIEAYGDKLIELFQFAKDRRVYIDQIGKIVSAIIYRSPILIACKAGLSQRTFYPDGSETICTKIDTCKLHNLHNYFESLPFFNLSCKDCIAVGLCGGGCAWDACVKPASNGLDWRVCKFKKKLVNHILSDIKTTLTHAATIKEAKSILNRVYRPMCNNYSEE